MEAASTPIGRSASDGCFSRFRRLARQAEATNRSTSMRRVTFFQGTPFSRAINWAAVATIGIIFMAENAKACV